MKKPLSGILSPCQEKEAAKKYGFTLVELIVAITILAILGTIAFISLQSYSKYARDSTRISDLSVMKTSLELFQLDAGKYPETTNGFIVTYSGTEVWTQGIFGENTITNVEKLDKIPKDPLTDKEYTYSITKTKQEYQLAGLIEGDEIVLNNNILLNQTNATEVVATAIVTGNYNGQILKTETGVVCEVLSVPSIISSESAITDLKTILDNKSLVYSGFNNLPSNYEGSKYKTNEGFEFISEKLVVYSDNQECRPLYDSENATARINLVKNLQTAYIGTLIENSENIKGLISINVEDTEAIKLLSASIINNSLGGKILLSTSTLVNACATQPEYTGASFNIGIATEPNQSWQSTNTSAPCYWTCGVGKVLDENTCVSETCAGTTPDGTAKVSNATSFVGGTWAYNLTPGLCTYSCGTQYHTEDNNTCISNTKSCTFTYGIGEQTWNGTSRGACIATSCTDGYTGTSCEIPSIQFLSNCTANGQIYYTDNGGNKLATVTNAGVATWVSGKSETDLTCAGNIIMCTGNSAGYTLQACNVGATTLFKNQTFTSTTSVRDSTINLWAGGLYQWGNKAEVSYANTSTSKYICTENSTVSQATFITGTSDWCTVQTDNAWGNTANNNIARIGPCATGYHVPTNAEWIAIVAAGGWGTRQGANMVNTLKLPLAGNRTWAGAGMLDQNNIGRYWSSSPYTNIAYVIAITPTSVTTSSNIGRASALPVRCFKN